jgi:hypothetical protein
VTELNDESQPPEFQMQCPMCGHLVNGQNPLQTLYQCPACNAEFLRPLADPTDSRDAELSGLHIQNVSVLRRATYRTRSHFIVGAAASLVAVFEMLLMLIRSYRYHTWLGAIASVCVGAALSMLFWLCLKRALQLTHELQESKLPSPIEPQDFSKLGDGSQRIRDLENLVSGDSNAPGA